MSQPATEQRIVLITRKTRLDELILRFNTRDQARFYVKHLGADFSDYEAEDRVYKTQLQQLQMVLMQMARVHVVDRAFLPNFLFAEKDTVVALGQDGLVANVLKYLSGQPLIGVNPDPARWEGVLLPFTPNDVAKVLPAVLARDSKPQSCRLQSITMAHVRLNTGEELFAVNDFFIGPKSHTSARYTITSAQTTERHSSSGVIVSTGLGSSGWLRSVLAGASGIVSTLGGQAQINPKVMPQWDSPYLVFSVREPWPSKQSSARLTFGTVSAEAPLRIVSEMPDNGVIFSDGIEADFLRFNAGTQADIAVAERSGLLVVG